MPRRSICLLVLLALTSAFPLLTLAQDLDLTVETYTLANGLTVTLHEDHTLPQVVTNTWFAVGSKDEAAGRSGFAHLFEHLMFMGTERVPGSDYDVIMESGGGANNASTSSDRTNYYCWGPPSLLPVLLWLDADRLDALGRCMTAEKLDLQRDVVRNELRQRVENSPYGASLALIPQLLYPPGHPYHHPVIGSHEDLAAATLADVKAFFATYYTPGNASLVVAGDFDSEQVKQAIASTFGAVAAGPPPRHGAAEPVVLEDEVRRTTLDRVQYARLYLVWHAPATFAAGEAEMDLLSSILADGQSSRLHRRLVIEEQLARHVSAYVSSKKLGSELRIIATAGERGDLDRIKQVILSEIGDLQQHGPTPGELQRVKAAAETRFLEDVESLQQRADMMNQYLHHWGDANGFARDLARITGVTRSDLQRWAQQMLGEGRLDLRILPEDTASATRLDKQPAPFAERDFTPPLPISFTLANGLPVHLLTRPGSGLVAGALVVDGGDRLLASQQAGLAALAATMLTAGAGGRSAAELADAVATLGAEIEAEADRQSLVVRVSGLSSRLQPALDLFADVILRPNLSGDDFAREQRLALEGIRSRVENPMRVARLAGRARLFGRETSHGRPTSGYAETVQELSLSQLTRTLPQLLDPGNAQLVFAGDLDRAELETALNARLGRWKAERGSLAAPAPSPAAAPAGRLVLVDRPGAAQTVLHLVRAVAPPADFDQRVQREILVTVLGGTFTSRLMQNIREEHGFSYGAFAKIEQEGDQYLLRASTSVHTEVTAAALTELKRELDSLAGGGISDGELAKAVRTLRHKLVTDGATSSSLAQNLQRIVADHLPLDTVHRSLASLGWTDLESVNAAARSGLFDWDSFVVVMVGDAATVVPQLEEAGFGKPLMADPEGTLL